MGRVVLAVSGTLQEGFPLRKNLDAPGRPAVHLGSGLVRCVKSYLDVKEPGCREHGKGANPCCVVTGDPRDANVYEVYVVDGEACVRALVGEPRYLSMAPDCVTLDLSAPETSASVRAFAREALGPGVARCSVLAVVSAIAAAPSFVETPSAREGGATDFASGSELAAAAVAAAADDGAAKRLCRETLGGAAPRLSSVLTEARASALLRAAGVPADLSPRGKGSRRRATAALRLLPAAAAMLYPLCFWGRGKHQRSVALGAFAAGVVAANAARRLGDVLHARSMERRATAAASPGAELGDARIACGSGRAFHVSRRDTAVVCIDLQVDFLDVDNGRVARHYDAKTLARCRRAAEKSAELLAAARNQGLTVAHSRSHRYGARIYRNLVGDAGHALADAVAALPGEIVVDKWTFGAFASTDLEAQLRARGVTRILLCGVLTNVCVMATAVQAVDRLFRVCLVEDACGAYDETWHDQAVNLINGPQVKAGHATLPAATGLYFGEVASVAAVAHALDGLPPASD